jgi:hypothetical protein
MKHLAPLSFWLSLGITTVSLSICAREICPGVAKRIRPEVFAFRDKFLGSYGPVSLDEYILGHDVLGAGTQVKTKDVVLMGSSKMMYGVDAWLLERLLASKGLNLGVYNLAFGHGEGLVFPAWLIQHLGIRNKVVLIDATDNTSQYHLESTSQAAMNSSQLEAWKLIIETNLQFQFDRMLEGLLPRGTINDTGIAFESAYLRPAHWRDWRTGDVFTHPGPNSYPASPGIFPFDFDADHRLRDKVFALFGDLNLDYSLISIPYSGNDPKWVQQTAKYLGCWYIPIESANLYTVDKVHLNKQSREVFTQRLADALTQDAFRLADRFSEIRSNRVAKSRPVPSAGSSAPVLRLVIKSYNIVLFKGRYYVLPHGLAVDWEKDEVEKQRGVAVRESLEEAVELITTGGIPPALPVLQRVVQSFNIVLFKDRYYVVPHGLPVDWEKDDVVRLPGVTVHASLDEAVAFISKR